MKIDTTRWKKFPITDLFDLSLPQGDLQVKKVEGGNVPLITPSNSNNGLLKRISASSKSTKYSARALTVDMFGNAYYQDEDFFVTAHGHVNVLIPKFEINVYIGNFIASVIRAKFYKRYDFIEMCTQKMLKKESISLPVLTNGLPDWDYMESSMKGFMFESESRLGEIKCVSPTRNVVNTNAWGEFVVGELFDKLDLKCRKANFNKVLDCSEYPDEEFSLPLVNAKHFNNGIQFYGRPDEWDSAEMTIDIVSNGAVATGDVYAQPQRTGVLWDAYLIKCHYEIKSEYVLHFLACVIEKCVKQYFGWDEKCTWERVKKKMIKLPVSSNGEPDWVSMESCMKRIMDESEKRIECLRMGLTQEYML